MSRMQKNKKSIDIIGKVLQACYEHDTDSLFIMSLMHQYEERGSLSKKQIAGLCSVADRKSTRLNSSHSSVSRMPSSA